MWIFLLDNSWGLGKMGMLSYRMNRPALVPSSPGSPSGTVTQHTRAGFLPMYQPVLSGVPYGGFLRSLNRTVQSGTRIGMWATRYPSPWASKADASPGHRQSQGSDRSEPSQRIDGLGIGAAAGGRCPARTPLQADPTGTGPPSTVGQREDMDMPNPSSTVSRAGTSR